MALSHKDDLPHSAGCGSDSGSQPQGGHGAHPLAICCSFGTDPSGLLCFASAIATGRSLSTSQASALASALDLDLDIAGVCHACLSFVSLAMDAGDTAAIERELRRMTPDLWGDGLAEPALAAVRRASERRLPDAETALADLERHGARSVVAREIVRRLAAELSRRADASRRVRGLARDRLRLAPPELN